MRRIIAVLFVFSIIFGFAQMAQAGSITITQHPETQTVKAGGSISFTVQAEGAKNQSIMWYFVDPVTGQETTGRKLSEVIKGVRVKNPNSLTISLQNIPATMHGWTVYCHIGKKTGGVDSDPVMILISGMKEPYVNSQESGNTIDFNNEDINAVIETMMENVNGTELYLIDDLYKSPRKFEQKIEYDKVANCFTHYISYPQFIISGYFLNVDDIDSGKAESLFRIWTACRKYAEVWLWADKADAIAIKGCTIIMKFVTSLDVDSEEYYECYTISMKGNKVTVINNIFTDEYEPVNSFNVSF